MTGVQTCALPIYEAERDYYAARGGIDKAEKETRDLTRQRELADSLTLELQGKRNEIQMQVIAVKDRLSVEFNVSLDRPEEPHDEQFTGNLEFVENSGQPSDTTNSGQLSFLASPLGVASAWSMDEARTLFGEKEDELRSRVNEFKARLDRIGPVNPMALEAYGEIKQRYDFIDGQKNDLLKAKHSLLETISEIDTVARQTF